MKVLSYNAFEGAENTQDYLFTLIERERPDLLQMQEINGWGEGSPNTLEKLAETVGFNGVVYGDSNTRFKLGTLSLQPFKSSQVLKEGFWHCAVGTTIPFGDDELHAWNLHLCPKLEDDRLPEIRQIIDQIDPGSYTLITGDLNSLAATDPYPKDLAKILAAIGLTKFGEGELRFDVTDALLAAGFVDVGAQYSWQNTVPTAANHDAAHAAALRLDYMFATAKLAALVTDYRVIKDSLSDEASDHYPIAVKFSEPYL